MRPRHLACLLLPLAAAVHAQSFADTGLDLAWLAGHWCGTRDGNRIEEVWLDRGGQLLNLSTTTRGDALVAFEYARIEPRAGGLVYVAQPNGVAPVEFALVDSAPRRVLFANPGHDFPQTVAYWRDDAGLHAEIAGPGELDDSGAAGEQRLAYDYTACAADVAFAATR
jgi:hypothetical protein